MPRRPIRHACLTLVMAVHVLYSSYKGMVNYVGEHLCTMKLTSSRSHILPDVPILPEIECFGEISVNELTGLVDIKYTPTYMPKSRDSRTRIFSLNCCPPEVLVYIFSLSCTDDGSTGRSLALVSRYIHDVSAFCKFQSIACRGAAQTIAFSSVLARTPSNLRVVRNLFVSTSHEDKLPVENPSKGSSQAPSFRVPVLRTRRSNQNDRTHSPEAAAHIDAKVYTAISDILTAVAPSLRTLSLYLDWDAWAILPMPLCLPDLVELSLNYQFPQNHFSSEGLLPLRSCPRLRRLVLTGFRRMTDPRHIVTEIQTLAPSVTHLCVPADTVGIWDLLFELKEGMNNTLISVFPRTLEQLVIHLPGHWLAPWAFKVFAWGDQRVVLVPRPWDRMRKDNIPREWEKEWIDRTAGGEGYWRIDDRYNLDH